MSNITHSEMVKGLAKPGENIIDELTPDAAHLLHMAVGIAGESGELCREIYNSDFFTLVNIDNVTEELGDLEFYIEGLSQGLSIKILCDESRLRRVISDSLAVAQHNSVLLTVESCILLDCIKKSAFYAKDVKIENVKESISKIVEHMLVIRLCFKITRKLTIDNNISKLGKRYKGHSYSNEQAIDRADKV